jgi:hypothetical protein
MIDVANFAGSITPDDYTIMVGNSNDINTWQPAPEPSFITEYVGAGVGGSVRLELVWDDYTIQNEWVQVTLKANANTGLADDDVFYFGNAIGETGNSSTDAIVDGADVTAVHNNYTATAAITNPYDFNRDKVVDATDEAIAAANQSGSSPLILFTAPGGIHGAGSSLPDEQLAVAVSSAPALGSEIASSAAVEPSIFSRGLWNSPAPLARAMAVDSVVDTMRHARDSSASDSLLEILAASHSHGGSNSDASPDSRHSNAGSAANPTGDDVVMSDAFHDCLDKFELEFHHKLFASKS